MHKNNSIFSSFFFLFSLNLPLHPCSTAIAWQLKIHFCLCLLWWRRSANREKSAFRLVNSSKRQQKSNQRYKQMPIHNQTKPSRAEPKCCALFWIRMLRCSMVWRCVGVDFHIVHVPCPRVCVYHLCALHSKCLNKYNTSVCFHIHKPNKRTQTKKKCTAKQSNATHHKANHTAPHTIFFSNVDWNIQFVRLVNAVATHTLM